MGRVYRAFDPLVRRMVAIKTVKSEYLTRENSESYLKRFRREVQAAGILSHPNIVSIYDVGDDYFVMEFVEGATLSSILRDRGQLPLAEALSVLGPVAEALDHAHDAGIIHRDIKPPNIMVQPDGRPKLMDFGVARLESSAMTATGQFLGSPSYMAPEQISGGDVSRRSDLFSLAVVAYEMVTGQKPFQGDSITSVIYRVMTEAPPPPRQWNFELPTQYDDVFRRALSKNPAERYAAAGEFVAALDIKEFEVGFPGAAARHDRVAPEPASPEPVPDEAAGSAGGGKSQGDLPETQSMPSLAAVEAGSRPGPPATAARGARVVWMSAAAALLVAVSAAVLLSRAGSAPAAPEPLRIETDPSGAQVVVDGADAGTTPVAVGSLAPGLHVVRVTRDGYAPAELSVELVDGTSPAPLRFVLQPVTARLQVRSDPGGARLSVDGRPGGTTPVDGLELPAGLHELRLEQKGFQPWVREVDLQAGENPLVSAQMEPLPRPGRPPAPTPAPTPSAVAEGTLVEAGPDVTPPRRLSGDSVRFPDAARRLRILGSVRVDFIVDEKGGVGDLRITESAGDVLDDAVLEAVRTWRFEPATLRGVKVKVRWHTRQTFRRDN
jgi:serine/threonine-protein kinase